MNEVLGPIRSCLVQRRRWLRPRRRPPGCGHAGPGTRHRLAPIAQAVASVVGELLGANLKQVLDVRLQRVHEPDEGAPGKRVLVARVWPRGIKRESLHLDRWLPELGPSRDLRRWFGHRPERWEVFRLRCRAELEKPEQRRHLQELPALTSEGPLILLYGARDTTHNQAVVPREVLEELAE